MVYKSDLRFWFLEVPCLKVRKRPLKLATRLANRSQDDAPKMASVFRKIPKRKIFIFFLWRGGESSLKATVVLILSFCSRMKVFSQKIISF